MAIEAAKDVALSRQRLGTNRGPVIFGSLLCKSELDIREKLLPYVEEALKIEKGRSVFQIFLEIV